MALPTLRIIGFIIGIFLITLAIAMIVPMVTLVIYDRFEDLRSFLWASLLTFMAGLALKFSRDGERTSARRLFLFTLLYLPIALVVLLVSWQGK